MEQGKLIVFSAPSGSGKTTIVRHLLKQKELNLEFAISATSRKKRGDEVDEALLLRSHFKRGTNHLHEEAVFRVDPADAQHGLVFGTLAAHALVVARDFE